MQDAELKLAHSMPESIFDNEIETVMLHHSICIPSLALSLSCKGRVIYLFPQSLPLLRPWRCLPLHAGRRAAAGAQHA